MAKRPPNPDSVPPVIILPEKDDFVRSLQTDKFLESLRALHGDIVIARFDSSSDPADILDECRSLSLMQTHKAVIVDDAHDLLAEKEDDDSPPPPRSRSSTRARPAASARELFERYAQNPCDSATLILRSGAWRKGNLDKHAAVRTFDKEKLTPAGAADWVCRRVEARHDATIEQAAADLLVSRVGVNFARLDAEARKLAAFVGPKGAITTDLVREMVGLSREEVAWKLQHLLATSDAPAALAAIHEALEVWRVNDVFAHYNVAETIRKLHAASAMLRQGASRGHIMQACKLWGPDGEALLSVAQRLEPGPLLDLLLDAVDRDAMIKRSEADPRRSAESLAIKFASLSA